MAKENVQNRPRVGIGIIIENARKEILIGKRIGSHAPYYSIPGGNLEPGETFEQAACREAEEELGIKLIGHKIIALTNNLETYRQEGLHYISIIVQAQSFSGKPQIMEPNKCAELLWCDPRELPQPHFDASELAVKCFLNGTFYEGES